MSTGALSDEVTWTLPHLEAAVLQSIGRTPAKNPATSENWPAIKSLADVLACRFNLDSFVKSFVLFLLVMLIVVAATLGLRSKKQTQRWLKQAL